MSSLVVKVATISNIRNHTNADALEIAEVLGWQVVVRKGTFLAGQKVVYFPPNTMLPLAVSDKFGVTKYLAKGRIRCASISGESSFGLVVEPDDASWAIDMNVADHYGATKYEPPLLPGCGEEESPHPYFIKYTDVEDIRNFPHAIRLGEEVVITEKIDGTNCRVGIIDGEFMAGSRDTRRKEPSEEEMRSNLFWYPFTKAGVRDMLVELAEEHNHVILFGETYSGATGSSHGLGDRIDFIAFDLMINGKYLDHDDFLDKCRRFGLPTAPILYRGPFHMHTVKDVGAGESVLALADHQMEGVVIRPTKERTDPGLPDGRVILKYISDLAFLGKEESDFKQPVTCGSL